MQYYRYEQYTSQTVRKNEKFVSIQLYLGI